MIKTSKIFVAGHNGMVGSAILRHLSFLGYKNVITKSSKELDLRNQALVKQFFKEENPEYVFLCAAKVGGIYANNKYKGEFIYDNLMIEANVIKFSHEFNVIKLLFLGSSCIYPKKASQPIKEEYLLSGYLEETNQAYAIAKIAGIELCKSFRDQYNSNFICAMPTNLYGYNDNYHPKNSHVVPSLIRKFCSAIKNNLSSVEIWGSGSPLREFLFVDDLAEACVFLMNNYNNKEIVNIGFGSDISIKDLAKLISKKTNYKGKIIFNKSMPDGTLKKLMDSSKINSLGWKPKISLDFGLELAINDYKNNYE